MSKRAVAPAKRRRRRQREIEQAATLVGNEQLALMQGPVLRIIARNSSLRDLLSLCQSNRAMRAECTKTEPWTAWLRGRNSFKAAYEEIRSALFDDVHTDDLHLIIAAMRTLLAADNSNYPDTLAALLEEYLVGESPPDLAVPQSSQRLYLLIGALPANDRLDFIQRDFVIAYIVRESRYEPLLRGIIAHNGSDRELDLDHPFESLWTGAIHYGNRLALRLLFNDMAAYYRHELDRLADDPFRQRNTLNNLQDRIEDILSVWQRQPEGALTPADIVETLRASDMHNLLARYNINIVEEEE